MAGQGTVGLGEVEARQLELRGQLVEVEAAVQVAAHHRLHRVHVQHPSGLQCGADRQHGQRAEQRLQLVGGVDEVRRVEAAAVQAEQRLEVGQQAWLHTDTTYTGLAQQAQEVVAQGAVEMHPVDGPGPLRVGAVGVRQALGQQQQVTATHLQSSIPAVQPATPGAAVDEQVVIR